MLFVQAELLLNHSQRSYRAQNWHRIKQHYIFWSFFTQCSMKDQTKIIWWWKSSDVFDIFLNPVCALGGLHSARAAIAFKLKWVLIANKASHLSSFQWEPGWVWAGVCIPPWLYQKAKCAQSCTGSQCFPCGKGIYCSEFSLLSLGCPVISESHCSLLWCDCFPHSSAAMAVFAFCSNSTLFFEHKIGKALISWLSGR